MDSRYQNYNAGRSDDYYGQQQQQSSSRSSRQSSSSYYYAQQEPTPPLQSLILSVHKFIEDLIRDFPRGSMCVGVALVAIMVVHFREKITNTIRGNTSSNARMILLNTIRGYIAEIYILLASFWFYLSDAWITLTGLHFVASSPGQHPPPNETGNNTGSNNSTNTSSSSSNRMLRAARGVIRRGDALLALPELEEIPVSSDRTNQSSTVTKHVQSSSSSSVPPERGAAANNKPILKENELRSKTIITTNNAAKTLPKLHDADEIVPAFIHPNAYPEGWLVYDRIYGVIQKDVLDRLRLRSSMEEKKDEDDQQHSYASNTTSSLRKRSVAATATSSSEKLRSSPIITVQ